jgi:hypothetical protein
VKQAKQGVETDLRGLESETKDEVLAGVKKVYTKFPSMKGAVPAIKVDYAMDVGDYGVTFKLDGAIALNGSLFSNVTKLKERYANDVSIMEHPQGTDYRSIVIHEVGHSIMLKLSVKRGLRVKKLCTKIQKDVLDYFNLSEDQITNELSRYAKKSSFDFVAEGLAEFIDSKTPRRVALKIGEIVLANLKELQ